MPCDARAGPPAAGSGSRLRVRRRWAATPSAPRRRPRLRARMKGRTSGAMRPRAAPSAPGGGAGPASRSPGSGGRSAPVRRSAAPSAIRAPANSRADPPGPPSSLATSSITASTVSMKPSRPFFLRQRRARHGPGDPRIASHRAAQQRPQVLERGAVAGKAVQQPGAAGCLHPRCRKRGSRPWSFSQCVGHPRGEAPVLIPSD